MKLSQFDSSLDDCIVRRADQIVSYHFASVIDDALLGITDILRGDDLFDVASIQKSLFEILEFVAPTFEYAPLRCDRNGRKLSKRHSSAGLHSLTGTGSLPEDVIGLLAADLRLVPRGSRLSADDLLSHVMS